RRAGVPTADFIATDSWDAAERYIAAHAGPLVVKADGLCAGKGVIVCSTTGEARAAARRILVEREFGEAGALIVMEERLRGREVSVMALCDGERVVVLP